MDSHPQVPQDNDVNQEVNAQLNSGAITGKKVIQPDSQGSQPGPAVAPIVYQPKSDQTSEGLIPQANSLPKENSLAPNTDENIILSDTGHLQNLVQGGVSAKTVNLTLYNTHLKIDDADTGETIEDVPINQIKKTSRIFSSRILYSLFTRGVLGIETTSKYYKISWTNLDATAVALRSSAGGVNALRNYKKNMAWVNAIKSLRAGTQVTPQPGMINAQQPTQQAYSAQDNSNSTGKGRGYLLIFSPIIMLVIGFGLVAISIKFSIHSSVLVAAAFIFILFGFFTLPWGLIFGLRKLRGK